MTSTTISQDLDRLSDEVFRVLSTTTPPRNYAAAVPLLFDKYALRVKADNLRAWHIRRVAVIDSDQSTPDIRSPIDEYAEAILVWKDPSAPTMYWPTIAKKLSENFGFVVTQGALRGWWFRRKRAGAKAAVALALVQDGLRVAGAPAPTPTPPSPQNATPVHPPAPIPVVIAPPASPQNQAVRPPVNGETPAQRQVREDREAAQQPTRVTGILAMLEAKTVAAASGSAGSAA